MKLPLIKMIKVMIPQEKILAFIAKCIRDILFPPNRKTFSNSSLGTLSMTVTRTLDTAQTTRYLLARTGIQPLSVDVCNANNRPTGVMGDTGNAGDPVVVHLLGNSASTLLMIASGPILAGADVYTAAGGKVQSTLTAAGTYYQVGTALIAAAANNSLLEVEPCFPRKTVVLAALSGNATTDVAALGVAFQQAPDRLIVL